MAAIRYPRLTEPLYIPAEKIQQAADLTPDTLLGYHGGVDQAIKKRALRRLHIVKGQIGGLEKMVGEEEYCIDIITQSSAVRQALSGIEGLLLENHLATHVVMQMKAGKGKRAANEILKVYKLSQRK